MGPETGKGERVSQVQPSHSPQASDLRRGLASAPTATPQFPQPQYPHGRDPTVDSKLLTLDTCSSDNRRLPAFPILQQQLPLLTACVLVSAPDPPAGPSNCQLQLSQQPGLCYSHPPTGQPLAAAAPIAINRVVTLNSVLQAIHGPSKLEFGGIRAAPVLLCLLQGVIGPGDLPSV